jgi:UDP-glucose 4-epimerase
VAAICGKRTFPLPPVGMNLLAGPLSRLGVIDLPPELLGLLRHGRGVDNRRLKQAGFEYRYTSAGAVADFVEAMRIRRMVGNSQRAYSYESDVEQFFRHSPAVIRDDNP